MIAKTATLNRAISTEACIKMLTALMEMTQLFDMTAENIQLLRSLIKLFIRRRWLARIARRILRLS